MTTSPEIHELATALAKAQGEMSGATKSSSNPFFKSKYADLASVREACLSALNKHGLSVLQSPSADGPKVSVETCLLHTSGQWIRDILTVTAKEDTPQAVGSCITYCRRYSLSAFAGIAPEDDDAEAAEGRGNGKAAIKAVPKVPAGFNEWLTGFRTAADDGLASMRAFWKDSPQTMRDYLMISAPGVIDELKIQAAVADAARIVSPEAAHQEAVASMTKGAR